MDFRLPKRLPSGKIIKSMEYRFIKYAPSHLSSLINLLTKTFAIKNANKKALIRWKYFDRYFNNKSITYIAIDEKNAVVGHYSSMPIAITYGKMQYKTTLSTDAATDPQHRGKGIMSRLSKALYSDVREQGYAFSFGFPNEIGVFMDKYSKNYGYRLVGVFVKYVTFILFRKKTPYLLTRIHSHSELEDISSNSENYFMIKKDRDYLTWRYLNKPNHEYKVYCVRRSKKTVGYVVLRFTRIKCYVYDIIADHTDIPSLKSILRSIANTALDRNIRIVVYTVLDNSYWVTLFPFPYVKMFYNKSHYYFSVHPHKENLSSTVFDKDQWLLMSGDIL